MALGRLYQVFGEFMVYVFGGGGRFDEVTELGITSEPVIIRPRYFHHPVLVSDFGKDVPVDVLTMTSYVDVSMTLVHFDYEVLQQCMGLAMGNSIPTVGSNNFDGTVASAGTPLGGGGEIGSSKNKFVSVNLLPGLTDLDTLAIPWRFRQCYLNSEPIEIPLGTLHSQVRLNWRCLPYVVPTLEDGWDVQSDRVVIFDHEFDGD